MRSRSALLKCGSLVIGYKTEISLGTIWLCPTCKGRWVIHFLANAMRDVQMDKVGALNTHTLKEYIKNLMSQNIFNAHCNTIK